MRTILALAALAAGCTDQIYTPGWDTGTAETSTPAPVPAVHAEQHEWAAGACDPVRIPAGAIVQLLDCNDMSNGTHQCWPDAEQRLTILDGVAHVLCPEDRYAPDSYLLTVLSVG